MKAVNMLMMGGKKRSTYGYYYNVAAVMDANFFPTDWGVPTRAQFDTLSTFLDYYLGGGILKEVGLTHWNTPNTDAVDTYGFSLLGGGYLGSNGVFSDFKNTGQFWVYDTPASYHWLCGANYNDAALDPQNQITPDFYNTGGNARAIYNGAGTPPSTITDYDGNVYDVIQIDAQYYTKQNWKCSKLNNGTALTRINNSTEWSAASGAYFTPYDYNENNV